MTDTNQTAKSLPYYHIDHTLYQGHPSDLTGRLAKEIRTYDLLDSLGVFYTRVDHDTLPTIEACLEVGRLLGSEICKNLFLRNAQKTDLYLLLMPGNKKFKTAPLSRRTEGARLSFGESEFMEESMDLVPGSVTVMGLMNDKAGRVRLLIDRDILGGKPFGCHPCINTSSLMFSVRDLIDKILPIMGHPYTAVDLPHAEWPICVIQNKNDRQIRFLVSRSFFMDHVLSSWTMFLNRIRSYGLIAQFLNSHKFQDPLPSSLRHAPGQAAAR